MTDINDWTHIDTVVAGHLNFSQWPGTASFGPLGMQFDTFLFRSGSQISNKTVARSNFMSWSSKGFTANKQTLYRNVIFDHV